MYMETLQCKQLFEKSTSCLAFTTLIGLIANFKILETHRLLVLGNVNIHATPWQGWLKSL